MINTFDEKETYSTAVIDFENVVVISARKQFRNALSKHDFNCTKIFNYATHLLTNNQKYTVNTEKHCRNTRFGDAPSLK